MFECRGCTQHSKQCDFSRRKTSSIQLECLSSRFSEVRGWRMKTFRKISKISALTIAENEVYSGETCGNLYFQSTSLFMTFRSSLLLISHKCLLCCVKSFKLCWFRKTFGFFLSSIWISWIWFQLSHTRECVEFEVNDTREIMKLSQL